MSCEAHNRHNYPLIGWSLSPDGAEPGIMINTSLAKYTVSDHENTVSLRINGVNASDEGLYRCVYESGTIKHLCIFVHGKSVNY